MENDQDIERAETPGALLRQAREQAGLSIDEMAERLNLLRSFLSALENDDYRRLPGATFARGYLRNYARALKLDERRLLALFDARQPAPAASAALVVAATSRRPRYRPIALDSHGPRRHWGAVAALLVVLGLWGWQQMGEKAPELVSLTPENNSVTIGLPGGLDEPLAAANLLDAVELLPVEPLTPVAPAMSAEQAAEALAAAADRLNLRFSADCWVEIKDRDNKVLVAALKRADEQLQIEGRGPFKVLLGFAPGVEMAYNGRPVDIEVPSGARSARLIVGSS